MTENDRKNALDYARQEGLAEGERIGLEKGMENGLAKGRREGLEEGEKKGLATAAVGMKRMGMPVETIMQVTGLPEAVIAAL